MESMLSATRQGCTRGTPCQPSRADGMDLQRALDEAGTRILHDEIWVTPRVDRLGNKRPERVEVLQTRISQQKRTHALELGLQARAWPEPHPVFGLCASPRSPCPPYGRTLTDSNGAVVLIVRQSTTRIGSTVRTLDHLSLSWLTGNEHCQRAIVALGGVRATTTFNEPRREALAATEMTPEALRLELALALYQRGTPSFGKARELAGVSVCGFPAKLGCRGYPVHHAPRTAGRTWPPYLSLGGCERPEHRLPPHYIRLTRPARPRI